MEQSRKFTVLFESVADAAREAWKQARAAVLDRLNPPRFRAHCAACDGDESTAWCSSEVDVVAWGIAHGWRFTWNDPACTRLKDALGPKCVTEHHRWIDNAFTREESTS